MNELLSRSRNPRAVPLALTGLLVTTLALLASFALASTASAAVYKATVADPAGDAPAPGLDLNKVSTTYDNEAGSIRFELTLGGPLGSTPIQIANGVGTLRDGFCSSPLAVVGSLHPDGQVVWGVSSDGDAEIDASGTAQMAINGSKVTFEATDPALAGLTPNCGESVISDANNIETTFDGTNAFPVKLFRPKAKLKATISGPGKLKPRGRATVKVKVRNTGGRPANKVKVRLTGKGGSVKPKTRTLGKLKAGATKTAKFKVRAGKKGKVRLKAKVTGANRLTASANKSVRIVKLVKKKPAGKSAGLVGRLFWTFEDYQWDRSPDTLGLYFANAKFVHWGIPKGGLKNCSKVTAKPDEDGELQPGCLRYSYNPKTGKLQIGKAKGIFRDGKLSMKKMDRDVWQTSGKITWYPSAFAKPGARFKLTLKNATFFGACGISLYCSTTQEFITLERNGKFGRTSSSLATSGGGSIPFIAVGHYPPENRGTYEVLSRGRIRFKFDDGKAKTETLTIQTNKRGKPDAANEGILLDDAWFWKDEDDEDG
jgi:hypothetical protein